MPYTTFDIKPNSVAAAKEFMDVYNMKESSLPAFTSTSYTNTSDQSRQYLPSSFTSSSSDWEFFRNELEFE